MTTDSDTKEAACGDRPGWYGQACTKSVEHGGKHSNGSEEWDPKVCEAIGPGIVRCREPFGHPGDHRGPNSDGIFTEWPALEIESPNLHDVEEARRPAETAPSLADVKAKRWKASKNAAKPPSIESLRTLGKRFAARLSGAAKLALPDMSADPTVDVYPMNGGTHPFRVVVGFQGLRFVGNSVEHAFGKAERWLRDVVTEKAIQSRRVHVETEGARAEVVRLLRVVPPVVEPRGFDPERMPR